MKDKNENKINMVVQNAIKTLGEVLESDVVFSKPVDMPNGDTIFTVSKVSFAVLGGGGEYGKTNLFSKNEQLPFSAGNGSIVSVKPCAFLINHKNEYKILSVNDQPIDKLIDKFESVFKNISKNYEN